MSKVKKLEIDDSFIDELFSHSTFQTKLTQFQDKYISRADTLFSKINTFHNSHINIIVEEICQILSQQYRQTIDKECLNLYQVHIQILKEIQQLKFSTYPLSPTKTEISSGGKQKNNERSIFSEPSLQLQNDSYNFKKNIDDLHEKIKENSFFNSFIFESGSKQLKQQLQEKINASNATIQNLSGDVTKFQVEVGQKLKNIEANLNRKIQSIYKTLTVIFQAMNDIQSRAQELKYKSNNQKQEVNNVNQNKKNHSDKMTIDSKVTNFNAKATINEERLNRRLFLGFLKY